MPKGAEITEIDIYELEGLKPNHKWSCSKSSCHFKGGSPGSINVWPVTEAEAADFDVTAKLKGEGVWYGITKEYECRVKISPD